MPELSFYNANEHRAYPLTETSQRDSGNGLSILPDNAIAHFMLVALEGSRFQSGVSEVWLSRVKRTSSNVFEFTFSTDAAGIPSSWTFSRNSDSPRHAVEVMESPSKYEAILVTGLLSDLSQLLDLGESISGKSIVEPSTVQNLNEGMVTSINVANKDRARVVDPTCEAEWSFTLADLYVIATDLVGDVRISDGANCNIEQSASDNSVIIVAEAGGGTGYPCEEILVMASEAPPSGRSLVDGSLACNEVVSSINGASGKNLQISAGDGVVVTTFPDEHKLKIAIGDVI